MSGNAHRTGSRLTRISVKEDVFSSSGDSARGTANPRRKLVLSVAAAADGLFAVLFPSSCRLCAVPLTQISRLPVCLTCLDSIKAITGQVCAVCGERVSRIDPQGERILCLECMQAEPVFTRAAAYGSYDARMRELIHLLKYEHVRPAADVLGRMLADVIANLSDAFTADPVMVPVPLYVSKLRERGFNQSEAIARAALKLHPGGLDRKLNTSVMVRQNNTVSQTGLTPAQRRNNMRGAFAVVRPDDIRGRDVVLVDDVLTTGTTASECARVLRRAGAARVFVATVARVLKSEPTRVHTNADEELRPQVLAAHI